MLSVGALCIKQLVTTQMGYNTMREATGHTLDTARHGWLQCLPACMHACAALLQLLHLQHAPLGPTQRLQQDTRCLPACLPACAAAAAALGTLSCATQPAAGPAPHLRHRREDRVLYLLGHVLHDATGTKAQHQLGRLVRSGLHGCRAAAHGPAQRVHCQLEQQRAHQSCRTRVCLSEVRREGGCCWHGDCGGWCVWRHGRRAWVWMRT